MMSSDNASARAIFWLNLAVSTSGCLLLGIAVGSHTSVADSYLGDYWGIVAIGIVLAILYRYLDGRRLSRAPHGTQKHTGESLVVFVITIMANLGLCPTLIFASVPRLLCLAACVFLAALPLAQVRVRT
ncbi:hypothetical protein F7230_06755 [Corynebacterium sp. 320]|nr:hypothetical protein F7230_06755 [Corynebacterium sp. 320]KAB1550547.1 hypothetical protein F7232_09755 [Corynebacterium sp. 319]KAB1554726.1 hypothetical protein F7233_00070 [Corynebacterium sp. 321]KAB3526378.1 hypothetical protein F8354_06755 [Corynebacterium sp. 250]KAB3537777.1 hypothetical protein F8390_09725 [Corynebacterium sp. 366]